MFALISSLSRSQLAQQVPVLGISIVIAEVFYKFHSFTLEVAAFLATWYVVDSLVSRVAVPLFSRAR
jgi:hypothetical protein